MGKDREKSAIISGTCSQPTLELPASLGLWFRKYGPRSASEIPSQGSNAPMRQQIHFTRASRPTRPDLILPEKKTGEDHK